MFDSDQFKIIETIEEDPQAPPKLAKVRKLDVVNKETEDVVHTERMIPDELVVSRPGATQDEITAAVAGVGLTVSEELGDGVFLLSDPQERPVEEVLADPGLAGLKETATIEPNGVVELVTMPNDPQFGALWGLHNTGQPFGTADADIDAPEAWDLRTDSTALVGVIDTGIDYTHPDLAANIWTNPGEVPGNRVDDDGNGYVDDVHGYDFINNDGDPMDDHSHGTHVAGTIGAVGNNGAGVAGVNWRVRMVGIKFLSSGGWGTLGDAVRAINYATDIGVTLTSNSWGGGGYYQSLVNAIARARDAGILFVAAAGNNGRDADRFPMYPAAYPLTNIVSVAATDFTDRLAWFSNYGATSVDLAAPGVSVLSTVPGNGYRYYSGTSMATPHVSGALGLLRTQYPGDTPTALVDRLLASVDVLDVLRGKTRTGGRLNLARALGVADTTGPRVTRHNLPSVNAPPVSELVLTFSEGLNPTTLTIDDITLTGPGGALTIAGMDLVAGTFNRDYRIRFSPATAVGTYTLTVGPNVSDAAGNLMDQDGDGTPGEPTQDRYTGTFGVRNLTTTTFRFSGLPVSLPDWRYTYVPLTIDSDLTITDVNVTLNITHPRTSDLNLTLFGPRGSVDLSNFRGYGANFADTIFDDEAATPISQGSPPFAGAYQPEEPLSAMDDTSMRGRWQLRVYDWRRDEDPDGVLNSLSLTFTHAQGVVNDPPVAAGAAVTTPEDTPVAVTLSASDPNGDALTYKITRQPASGALSGAVPNLTYTPRANFHGSDTFTFVANDGKVDSAPATVTVTVTPVNDAPVAHDTSADVIRGTTTSFAIRGSDADGDALTYAVATPPQHGTVSSGAAAVEATPFTLSDAIAAMTLHKDTWQVVEETDQALLAVHPKTAVTDVALESAVTLPAGADGTAGLLARYQSKEAYLVGEVARAAVSGDAARIVLVKDGSFVPAQ